MSRDDKKRKKERKARNAAVRAAGPQYHGEARNRWQGGKVSFQLGKDPRTRLDLEFSGVKVDVDVNDPSHMDGVVELTESVRSKNQAQN